MLTIIDLPVSSGSNGTKAISSLVLLDINWTHKCYISIFPKIYQLNFSVAAPSSAQYRVIVIITEQDSNWAEQVQAGCGWEG